MKHVSENTLLDFSAGLLTPAESAEVEAHVDTCAECREWVAAAARADDEEGPEERAPVHPQRGSSVGRYIVIEALGSGAMGVVFSAFDPVLDRKVALKFLHVHRQLANPEESRARLSREAQALARIAHPNVVAVHDVGTWEDQVFLAMEFVDGQDLDAFLWEHPLDLDRTLWLFREAGLGLAAVHEAGLVHRDFKAANVLVDSQGRVRVTDLGLARGEASGVPFTPSAVAPVLTQTGELLGTPAYMAPEQYRGAKVDARTDQFAFCVALYEALYGQLPFGVLPVPELAVAVQTGAVQPPPPNSKVPAWVRRVLLRGLSVDPAARFESMHALVEALGADPRRLRARVMVALGATLAVLGLLVFAASPEQRYCRDLEVPLTAKWNPKVKAGLASRFASNSLGERAWSSAESVLEAYANGWVTARTEACRATRVRGDQSEAAMDLRMECLDRRLVSFASLISTLERAEVDRLQRATDAARALDALASCSDGASLRLQTQPRPDQRAAVTVMETAVAESQALLNLGDYSAGLTRTEPLVAVKNAFLPVAASLHLVRGQLLFQLRRYDEAEAQLRLAHQESLASNSVVLASQAVIALISVVGNGLVRFEEAHQLAQVARAMLTGRGAEELALAEVLQADAAVFRRASDFKQAFALSDEATALLEKHLGPASPQLGRAVTERANALLSMGRYVEAETGHQRALALYLAEYGPEHPRVASAWSNVCLSRVRQRRGEDALTACTRALEIYARLSPDFPDSGLTLTHLGSTQVILRDFEGAIASFTRAISVLEKSMGAEHPLVATPLNNRANQYDRLDRKAEAEADYLRSLTIREKALGKWHADVGESLFNLAELRRGQGRCAEALELFERTLAIDELRLGPQHPFLAGDLGGLAHCRLETGQPAQAVLLFERALVIAEKEGDEEDRGNVRSGLAHALWATGAKERARGLSKQARADFVACGADCAAALGELKRWEEKM